MPNLESYFAIDGILSKFIPEYRARVHQKDMAEMVADTIANSNILIAEAGTGTGKTLAYLVPALLAGAKIIISTGTKTQQDQIFKRDIHTVQSALNVPVKIALLKGRANYVCHYNLEHTVKEGFLSRNDQEYLKLIERYAESSKNGDKSGINGVPENASIWQRVTSTRESCLGSDCPKYNKCFVLAARKKALSADLLIVNHHLFFADILLRDEGLAELLPTCDAVIFDEAHQLPETASLFFGESVSTGQLLQLMEEINIERAKSAKDFVALSDAILEVEKAARDLRLSIDSESVRFPKSTIIKNVEFRTNLNKLLDNLIVINSMLESQSVRSEGLDNCWQRVKEVVGKITCWENQAEMEGFVCWIETFSHTLQLNITPLSIAEHFNKHISSSIRAWIFTSATLSVNGDFSHYCNIMGLDPESSSVRTVSWESPFNFSDQALFYVPTGLPDPNDRCYVENIVKAILPVLKVSHGRAFILCTSLRSMQQIYDNLLNLFEQDGIVSPLLLQGQGSRSEMLGQFREMGNAVLIGSQSFWEGVDVRGEALSVVIIDRLPFAPPNDPVLAARIEKINQEGGNAFMEYQVPHAVINLRQGVGRLIRDEVDRGVLMICDHRIITKSYGKRIWQSLPPMRRTRNLNDVHDFFLTDH
ncbi:MAG: helicase [Nitrosomonadaceae bacterium]|nr:helicase [Nitrosomonadaceae bacterium]|tara:strand:- start:18972 stop:20912 length:1941 start_codon:yes stop_codon:yes gene_type:complete